MLKKTMERSTGLRGVQLLEEEKSLKVMEGEEGDQHFKSACIKKSILHNRLCMSEIARRAMIKESIM